MTIRRVRGVRRVGAFPQLTCAEGVGAQETRGRGGRWQPGLPAFLLFTHTHGEVRTGTEQEVESTDG